MSEKQSYESACKLALNRIEAVLGHIRFYALLLLTLSTVSMTALGNGWQPLTTPKPRKQNRCN